MTRATMTTYMHRAGIKSVRELSELTGIPKRSLDRIMGYPRGARGFQLDKIGRYLNMTDAELRDAIREEKK